MSRVGKDPIILPEGVTVELNLPYVVVKGPKGELRAELNALVSVVESTEESGRVLTVSVENTNDKNARSQWGTARSILANLVQGVHEGFSKSLEVIGVGYKANVQGKTLVVSAGYSHDVPLELPEGITASVENNVITVSGSDKQLVGQVASRIRKIRKPEPYKGKGIKYVDEVVRRKAGKTAKASE